MLTYASNMLRFIDFPYPSGQTIRSTSAWCSRILSTNMDLSTYSRPRSLRVLKSLQPIGIGFTTASLGSTSDIGNIKFRP